LLSW
jgi:predicted RecB family nuclease